MGDAVNRVLVEGQAMRGAPVDFQAGVDELFDTRHYPPRAQTAAWEGIGRVVVTGGNSGRRGCILF